MQFKKIQKSKISVLTKQEVLKVGDFQETTLSGEGE